MRNLSFHKKKSQNKIYSIFLLTLHTSFCMSETYGIMVIIQSVSNYFKCLSLEKQTWQTVPPATEGHSSYSTCLRNRSTEE